MSLRISILVMVILTVTGCSVPLFITEKNRDLYRFYKDGKYGYIDQKGRIVVAAIYDQAEEGFYAGDFGIVGKDKKIGAIDTKGTLIIPFHYDALEWCSNDGFFIAKQNGRYGMLNERNEILFPFVFDKEYFLESGLGTIDNLVYRLDFTNLKMIPTEYEEISPFFDGFAEVSVKGKSGFIDRDFKLRIPLIYEEVGSFNNGLAPVKVNSLWGFIDTTGTMMIQPSFFLTWGFDILYNEGFAVIYDHEFRSGLINTSGEIVIKPGFVKLNSEDAGIFSFYLREKDTLGLIDTNGNRLHKWKAYGVEYFDYFGGFVTLKDSTDRTGVRKLNSGQVIVPFIFNSLDYFQYGLSEFRYQDDKSGSIRGYIDKNGKLIWPRDRALKAKFRKAKRLQTRK